MVDWVQTKIEEYLTKLGQLSLSGTEKLDSAFKGLPKKYHPALEKVIDWLQQGSLGT